MTKEFRERSFSKIIMKIQEVKCETNKLKDDPDIWGRLRVQEIEDMHSFCEALISIASTVCLTHIA